MHKWIKTADEFYDHFCQQTLAIHAKAFNVETAKHKKKTANISSVVGKNVVVEVSTLYLLIDLLHLILILTGIPIS